MGNIFHDVFGGSSSKSQQSSQSGNNAYPFISSTFGPMATQGAGSTGEIAGLLGLGGGDPTAFNKYKNSTGYNFMLDSGSKAITNNAASRGLLNSGATLKAEQQFGQNLGSQYFNNYLGQLGDLGKLGLGAGGLISGAGQFSNSSGSSSADSETGTFGKFLGGILSAISDRRAKTNIERIGTLPDGLPVFAFDYRHDLGIELPQERQVGVMADDVARLQPWALGPKVNGFASVNYSKIRTAPDAAQVARFL